MMADMAEDARKENEDGIIDDAPQALTESYGTGVQPVPRMDVHEGTKTHAEGYIPDQLAEYTHPTPGLVAAEEEALWKEADTLEDQVGGNPVLTGGDIDAAWEQAATVGDEAVGGTVSTPDQDVVDEIGEAVGLEMNDRAFLRTNEILEQRDDRRWELDPTSSEDYENRRQ